MGMPYRPWTTSPAIHHRETPTVSKPMRPTAAAARGSVVSREPQMAHGTHSAGPRPASTMAVAFTLPAVVTVRANRAGHRHVGPRTERAVKAMSHGNAAHGSKITEMRAA